MEPSNKTEGMEAALTDIFGFDRREQIRANKCCPPPIGCGGDALGFRDALSEREYAINGLCQNCQDSVFDAEEPGDVLDTMPATPSPPRYAAGPGEFVTGDYQMYSGQDEAVAQRYHRYAGKSGNTWLVAGSEAAAENIYVTNTPANSGGEGFGGAHLPMPLLDGTTFVLKGGWHSNSDALFVDTGVDVRNKYRTFVLLAMERDSTEDGTFRSVFRRIIYQDEKPVLGRYDRYKEIIQAHPEADYYYMDSRGGSSHGLTDEGRKRWEAAKLAAK